MADDFTPPKQSRSRETYERILEAAEGLLQEQSLEGTSVREIVREAGCTEGSFYARFGTKESFIRHLEDRLAAEQRDVIRKYTGEEWDEADPERSVRSLIRAVIRLYGRQRGVFRALIVRSRSEEELRKRLDELGRENLEKVVEALLDSVAVRRPEPRFAARFAILAARATLREAVLFDELWPVKTRREKEQIVDELTTLILAYLNEERG